MSYLEKCQYGLGAGRASTLLIINFAGCDGNGIERMSIFLKDVYLAIFLRDVYLTTQGRNNLMARFSLERLRTHNRCEMGVDEASIEKA